MTSLFSDFITGFNSTTIAKSNGPDHTFPCTFTTTTIKLNSDNYLLWSQYFHVFVGAQRKIGIFLVDH